MKFIIVLEVLANSRKEKEIKAIYVRKKEVKMFVFTENMIFFNLENCLLENR